MFCLFSRGFYGLSTDQLSWRTFILIRNLDLQKGVCCIKEKDSAKAVWITQRPLGYFYDFITIYDFMNLACLEAAQLNARAFIQ